MTYVLGVCWRKIFENFIRSRIAKRIKDVQRGVLCALCQRKHTRVKFGTTIYNTKGILDYVHSHVWGASKTLSLGGKHDFVTFVDDFS